MLCNKQIPRCVKFHTFDKPPCIQYNRVTKYKEVFNLWKGILLMKKRASVTLCREIIIMSEANNKVLRFCPNFNSAAKSRGSYIPNLTLPPETDDRAIGIWGSRHKQYLKENKSALTSEWLISRFYVLLHRKTKSTFSEWTLSVL